MTLFIFRVKNNSYNEGDDNYEQRSKNFYSWSYWRSIINGGGWFSSGSSKKYSQTVQIITMNEEGDKLSLFSRYLHLL